MTRQRFADLIENRCVKTLSRREENDMTFSYVRDISNFLDHQGELAEMPKPARKMASFLVLLVDATTAAGRTGTLDSRIRCRTEGCTGSIRTRLADLDGEISWCCPKCGINGVIRGWQGTKWDQTRSPAY